MNLSLHEFLQDSTCLVVDPSSAFCAILQNGLESMGLDGRKIFASRNFAQATKYIAKNKPKVIICEHQIQDHFGLSLIEQQEKFHSEENRIAIIVANNSTDSVVAEAAEEQIDAYLLKPLSGDLFRQRLQAVIQRKANPSPYALCIKAGKDYMLNKSYDLAAKEFSTAKGLAEKPSLACFYAGQAALQQSHDAEALQEFKLGRSYQPLHYKCITGEFEILMGQQHYEEAYVLVDVLTKNFPLTPKRLKEIFMASVFTRNFADIGRYYDLYMQLEVKSPELTKVAAQALFSAGRYYIDPKKLFNKAFESFEQAATVMGRDFYFMEKIVAECLKIRAVREARQFLLKVRSDAVGTPAYNRLAFKVDAHLLPTPQVIERGRKLIADNQADPDIFLHVVKLLAADGKTTLCEAVITKAAGLYPQLRDPLYKILESALRKDE